MTTSRIASVLLLLALAGCATTPVVTIPALPVPAAPALPSIPADALACITDDTYVALVQRDATLQAYAARLRAIIEAHNRASEE